MYLQRQQKGVSVESQREGEAGARARARAKARAREAVPVWWGAHTTENTTFLQIRWMAVKTTVEIAQCAHFLDFRER